MAEGRFDIEAFFVNFYDAAAADGRIGPSHVSLYMALLRACQKGPWRNPFSFQRKAVMKDAKINSRHTLYKCLRELQDYGYLRYTPSRNASCSNEVFLVKAEDWKWNG